MRKFWEKIKQHKADLRLNKPLTAISRLIQTQPIKVDFNKAKITFCTNNYPEVIIRESIEIIANKDIACNGALSYDIHGVWEDLVHNT